MEAMAILGTYHALWEHDSIIMSTFFDRAMSAIISIEQHRAKTAPSEMEFFKERRHSLFKQWGVNVRRGINTSRDEKGKFCFTKEREFDDPENETIPHRKRQRMSVFDAYEDVFESFMRCALIT